MDLMNEVSLKGCALFFEESREVEYGLAHMNRSFILSSTLALVVVAAACGGGQTTTPNPDGPTPLPTDQPTAMPTSEPTMAMTADAAPTMSASASATPTTPPAPTAWKDMNHDQKIEFMKAKVMPAMMADFQAFDAKKFKDFTCATCHGPGAKEGKFKMPNDKLPKLSPADNFKKHAKQKAMLDFMMQKVTPTMTSLLGAQPFDPKSMQGFGCGGCHVMQ
jgi:hypothetical protein